MGGGYYGGFGNTKGSAQKEKYSESRDEGQINALNIKDELINELLQNDVKISVDDIVFITRDESNQIVWLEKGNSTAGLEHIINGNGITSGHASDFEKAFGISKDQIPNYLNKVISCGKIISNKLIKKGNRDGFERIYYYEGKHYVVTGIGTNGFIVSAYPKKMKGDK
jgi:hypothetical protein